MNTLIQMPHNNDQMKLKSKKGIPRHYQKYGIHKTSNIDNLMDRIKIALCIHIGNIDIIRDMKIHISQMLIQIPRMFIYVSILDNIEISDNDILNILDCKDTSRIKIIRIHNRGMDIGGFLSCLSDIKKSNTRYDLYIKLHTKFDPIWRNQLLKPFRNLKDIIRIMYSEKKCWNDRCTRTSIIIIRSSTNL